MDFIFFYSMHHKLITKEILKIVLLHLILQVITCTTIQSTVLFQLKKNAQ